MKKWCVLSLIFILLVVVSNNQKEHTNLVFEETEKVEFKLEQIDVSDTSITTKSITSLLNHVTLYKITYEIPKLYQSKFSNQDTNYYLHGIPNKVGLENVEKQLSKQMKEVGNTKEIEHIYFYGVKLLSIEVYGRVDKIEELKQRLKRLS